MTSTLRKIGAVACAALTAITLAACSPASSNSSQSGVLECTTDDSAEQAQVDRSEAGYFPKVTGTETPVIDPATGSEPTDKVLVKTLTKGDGPEVCPGAQVKVNYVGALWDGTKFDSSYDKGKPVSFSLSGVIKGWGYALAHAHVGDRLELVIPSSLGYGESGGQQIPPNSTLVFVVDILEQQGVSRQDLADEATLTGAEATGEELPAGITVTGGPGVEPTLTIDESQPMPTEQQVYTVYKGTGEALAATDTVLMKGVAGGWGVQGRTESSWNSEPLQQPVAQTPFAGYTIGSRIVVVSPIPAQAGQSGQSGTEAQAIVRVFDIVGKMEYLDSTGKPTTPPRG